MTAVYSIDELLTAVDAVEPLFQPILWLDDLSLAGYEALARGPRESPLAMPLDLFAAAKAGGLVGDLESAMTKATLEAVMATPWDPSVTVFGNVEPEAMMSPLAPETMAILDVAERRGVRMILEITERALLTNPASLIASSDAARSRGWGVAMDDVGAFDDTLTLLWVLQPDIVKLDMSILHRQFDNRAAHVSATARHYCDQTGALLVCEGVESEAHENRARALGADLVQGFRYAMPDRRPEIVLPTARPIGLRGVSVGDPIPFVDCVAQVEVDTLPGSQVEKMAAELLAVVSMHTDSAIVVATAPSAETVPPGYIEVLSTIAPRASLVALIAPGVGAEPAPGVVGVDSDAGPHLGSPWSLTVIAPSMAASILTEPFAEIGSTGPVAHRVLHDRPTVAHGVRVLLSHILTTR
ncbi:EAL domain-containing protein [Actinospongicola halichondriae]|uniref:EAL domain-containing protein n=1 Tax=Actinospongicola halichondriae TaxID=3236844 RepID=UPI003D4033E5